MTNDIEHGIFAATWHNDLKTVKYFVERYEYMILSPSLRIACFNGHLEEVKYLIKHGANMHIADHNHIALRFSCGRGHTDIIKYLVDNYYE